MTKYLICGDFTTRGRGQKAVQNGIAFSNDIRNLLKCNYSIINLESPIAEEHDIPIPKIGPAMKMAMDSIQYLKSVGVDAVTLANNHFFDYGKQGVSRTILTLMQFDIEFVGTAQKRCLSLNDVHILNYCESEFSVNKNNGSAPINPIAVYYDISKLKTEKKPIIVITHGGHEGYNLPSPRMKELYRFIIDCGADVVINHHQHCFSGYEQYNNGLIFYGLGNFYFDIDASNPAAKLWNDGYMVELDISRERVEKYSVIPYKQCLSDAPICRLLNSDEKLVFENKIESLNKIIGDDLDLHRNYEEFVDMHKTFQLGNFTPYSNRLLLALYRRHFLPSFITERKKLQLLNMLRCESHRDLAILSLIK